MAPTTSDSPDISQVSSVDVENQSGAHRTTITGATFTSDLKCKLSDPGPPHWSNRGVFRYLIPTNLITEFATVWRYHTADWFGLEKFNSDRSTVLVSALYVFSFSFLTSASFGFLFATDTGNTWGVAQSFLSGGMTGLFMSIVGGQPLVLYGQTGPIVLLYVYAYEFAHENSIPFAGFIAWIGVWSAIQHFAIAIAGINDVKILNYITRFTGEIFELLVAADYITAGIIGFYKAYEAGKGCFIPECASNPSVAYLNGTFNLLLGLFFFVIAVKMQSADKGGISFGTYTMRKSISMFGCLLALFIATLLSYAPQWDRVVGWPSPGIPARVTISPASWGNPRLDLSLGFNEMGGMEASYIFGAIIPATLLTVLFYVDQNLSTLMAVRDGCRGIKQLDSPPAFNMDFFLLGVTVLVTGLMGLPASSGLIPQNPMHTKSLIVTLPPPAEPYVVEQRVSNIMHSGLLLLILLVLPGVGWIPTGVLWGAFFLLSVEASGAQFVRRCLLYFTSEKSKHLPGWEDLREIIDTVPSTTIHTFTGIQFLLWGVIFVTAVILKLPYPMNDGNMWVIIGSLFPIFVVLCAVFRFTLLRKWIPDRHLDILDPLESHGRLQIEEEDPNLEKDPDVFPPGGITPSGPSSSSSSSPESRGEEQQAQANGQLRQRNLAGGPASED